MLREYYTTKPQAPNWIVEVNMLISIYEDLKENSDIGVARLRHRTSRTSDPDLQPPQYYL